MRPELWCNYGQLWCNYRGRNVGTLSPELSTFVILPIMQFSVGRFIKKIAIFSQISYTDPKCQKRTLPQQIEIRPERSGAKPRPPLGPGRPELLGHFIAQETHNVITGKPSRLLNGPKIAFSPHRIDTLPDKREIWHGGRTVPNFTFIGAEMWEYCLHNCQHL